MSYETEDQQVEALKSWWAENGRAVIAGIAIGAVGIAGWSWWQSSQAGNAVAASESFSQAMAAIDGGNADEVYKLADKVVDEQSGTLYAAYTQLAAARAAAGAGDLKAAAERLQWVVDNADHQDTQVIAAIRLARVQASIGDAEKGLAALPEDYPQSYTGLVEEARGDLMVAGGDQAGARQAYEKAKASDSAADPALLTMKLNELVVAPGDS